jgi:hypothetical protein
LLSELDLSRADAKAYLFRLAFALKRNADNSSLAFHDFHCPAGVLLGCSVHQVSDYLTAEGGGRSMSAKSIPPSSSACSAF